MEAEERIAEEAAMEEVAIEEAAAEEIGAEETAAERKSARAKSAKKKAAEVEAAEERTEEERYQDVQNELDIIEVLTQPAEVAAAYRRAAKKMKELGDYRDAAALAEEYREKAKQAIEDGKEDLYQRAVKRMDGAASLVERNLAIDMFHQLGHYKDAKERIQECRNRNMREMRRRDLRNVLIGLALVLVAAAAVMWLR